MSKIFIIPQNGGNVDCSMKCIWLKHPRDLSKCMFYINESQNCIYELNSKQTKFYSWFMENKLINDGNIYITSQIDPIFLLIPFIFNNASKYQSLYDIFTENNITATQFGQLENLYPINVLKCIADCKEFENDIFIKFDKEKALKWLTLKFENIKKSLNKNRIGKSLSGFQISDYVSGDVKLSEEEYKIQAFEIISDYIYKDLAQELKQILCIPDINSLFAQNNGLASNKRKFDNTELNDGDYSTASNQHLVLDNNPRKQDTKKVKISRAQRILSKVDKSGIKNIASYFNKK